MRTSPTAPRSGWPIDELEGRITTSLVTPYPPGIPLLIPGEVFNKKIVDYLKFNREFARECPGFETDIHGLVQEVGCRRCGSLLCRLCWRMTSLKETRFCQR